MGDLISREYLLYELKRFEAQQYVATRVLQNTEVAIPQELVDELLKLVSNCVNKAVELVKAGGVDEID